MPQLPNITVQSVLVLRHKSSAVFHTWSVIWQPCDLQVMMASDDDTDLKTKRVCCPVEIRVRVSKVNSMS